MYRYTIKRLHKKALIALCFFWTVITLPLAAQDGSDYVDLIYSTSAESSAILQDTTVNGWVLNWVGGFNGSQASYKNWSQGGVNTISVTASTLFNLKYRKKSFGYNLVTNLKYGQARIEDKGTRKTDDKISVANKFSYIFDDDRFSAFGNINFTTQFDKGFDYGASSDGKLISRFMAPAYFSQIAGIGFSPNDFFTAEAGMALKETVVRDTSLSTRYGLDPGKKFRFEPGYAVILEFDKTILSNVRLVSSVETFTNLQESLRKTDVNFSNELIGKINDYMNTSFQFVLVYDEDFSREVQVKQVLSVGFSFNLL